MAAPEGLPRLAGPQRYEPDCELATLRDHPANPRRGDDAAVAGSLDANGWYGVIIAQAGTRRILAGHTRRRSLVAEGATHAPVLWLEVDDARAEAILLVDNRSAELATWDMDQLTELLTARAAADLGGLIGTGFTADDLAVLSAGVFISRQRDEDGDEDQAHDDRGLWPLLAFRVPPLMLQRFRALPGADDTDRLAGLLGLPQIGSQNENPGGGEQP